MSAKTTVKTTVVNVRTSPAIKKAATEIFDRLGLDLSSGVNLYLARVARDQGIPFPLYGADPGKRCPTCGHRAVDLTRLDSLA